MANGDPSPTPEASQAETEAETQSGEAAATEAQTSKAESSEPKLLLEPASSGRAGCRACGEKVAKGQLRLGERLPNPYTETDTTYWFHLECAAYRRPGPLLDAIALQQAAGVENADPLSEAQRLLAQTAVTHRRLARITRLELAPSGRARCRHCKEAIASGTLRFALTIFQEGRFDPMGFVHVSCSAAYFETPVELERALYHARQLPAEQQQLVRDTFA